MNSGKPLIDNIKMSYDQPELDFSLKPDKPTEWEIYLNRRYDSLEKCINNYRRLYLMLQRIVNIVLSGKVITDTKVKYIIKDEWDL